MPTVIIAFLSAIALAGVAAWFSITGLIAIFAALPISIAIMASVLEVAKLVTASILYRNWGTIPFLMKSYLTVAVVILMLITSLGIFGYLSKAHLEQNAPVSNNLAKIERLEQRITREGRTINDAETVIVQLDGAITTLIEYDKISGPDGARNVRAGQQEERDALNEIINSSQDSIDIYLDEKFGYEQEVRQFETEIGPIKYIAALAYDDPSSHYDSAVRAIILLLVFVFDPLAVLLLITANHIQMVHRVDPSGKLEDDLEDMFDVDDPNTIILGDEAFEDFVEALDKEPEPNEALTDLLSREAPWDADAPLVERLGVDEYTSVIELEAHDNDVLEAILDDMQKREQIKPLDHNTQDRRSAIVDILSRRKKVTGERRETNPLLNVTRNDKNIG